ncbi:MAG: SsrA-binding protein SmpB [SAR202 cluster bacterium]|nr:SsrA-binding protein SmpB [SAR202 cluster bacterium]
MGEDKTVSHNRRARFDYEILESLEAGLVLTGTEIKAIREGRVDLSDSYAGPKDGGLWMFNAHISQYSAGNLYNHEPTRPRKLLVRKDQARELVRQIKEKGLTLVPLKLYLKRGHWAKVELGVAKGRKRFDKRRAIIEKGRRREAEQAVKQAR